LRILLRFTVSLQDVVSLPMLLVARHAYSPSSSGNTSLIVRVATPFQTYASTLPSLLQVICGSGSPSTLAVSSRCSPSLIMSSFVVLLDRDGLPVVSSFEPSLPPLSLGGFHESVTDWLVISSYCKGPSGGPGLSKTVTWKLPSINFDKDLNLLKRGLATIGADASDGSPGPPLFTAMTLNSYS
ncbi:hypothetical protein ALC60_08167, partial [Trachymyrmex zeteki]